MCWGGGGEGRLIREWWKGLNRTFTDEHPGCFLFSENFQLEILETFQVGIVFSPSEQRPSIPVSNLKSHW